MYNICTLRDIEVAMCMIVVLLHRSDCMNHYLNIRCQKEYKAIVAQNSETIVNFEPKYNANIIIFLDLWEANRKMLNKVLISYEKLL